MHSYLLLYIAKRISLCLFSVNIVISEHKKLKYIDCPWKGEKNIVSFVLLLLLALSYVAQP